MRSGNVILAETKSKKGCYLAQVDKAARRPTVTAAEFSSEELEWEAFQDCKECDGGDYETTYAKKLRMVMSAIESLGPPRKVACIQ